MSLNDTFTSTGSKFFAHQEAMTKLRNGRGQPIVTHVMLTDVCNHKCAFCSVQHRAGDSLNANDVMSYIGILQSFGLKAVILSGGGNPILYKCKTTGADFNMIVDLIHKRGLEIGLITNGMPMWEYRTTWSAHPENRKWRKSWKTVEPETLDKLTWVRISMSGLDHEEREVYVPDINRDLTTLGFSYVAHDKYLEPADKKHGAVSRPLDLISRDRHTVPDVQFCDRMSELIEETVELVERYKPRYVRLLPNCLEPALIQSRCQQLGYMASVVNSAVEGEVAFVQYKPPRAPEACYLGYVHPVLNCDGYVYPCDSCVLNEAAGHTFANPWRMCHWSEVARIYEEPVRSLIADPAKLCPGCVFSGSNDILRDVVEGSMSLPVVPAQEHVNFV